MKLLFAFILLALTCSLASAEILSTQVTESGDAGKDFSRNLSVQMCANTNVQAVYICNGNVVKVINKDQSKGSTFYKPDGAVLNCPNVSATQMGAACVQMLLPNVCSKESTCGTSPVLPFPGQQNTSVTPPSTPITPSVDPTTPPVTQPVVNKTTAPPNQTTTPTPQLPATSDNTTQQTSTTKPKTDNNIALIMLAAGVILIAAINFFYFRSKRSSG